MSERCISCCCNFGRAHAPGSTEHLGTEGVGTGHRRPRAESLDERCLLSADVVIQWNQAVLAAIRTDKPSIGFATRDLAIVQTAIYDAVDAIDHTSRPFLVRAHARADASPVAAAAAAGLFTAADLFPTDTALFQATYQASLAGIPDGRAKTDGLAVGRFVAERTLISHVTDGANAVVDYTPGTAPGDWRPAPPAFGPAQTPQWPEVRPFALRSGSQFRPPPPPALNSPQYAAAFNEVKDFGAWTAPSARHNRRKSPGSGRARPAPRRCPATGTRSRKPRPCPRATRWTRMPGCSPS